MKITLVNHSDTLGGASVVTFRLMEALRVQGVDARMLVAHKSSDSPYVEQAAGNLRTKLPFLAEHLRIFTHNGFSRRDLFKASIATDGLPLSRHPLIRRADAVMLNWVNQGMLSLDEICRIAADKTVIWTMHDMWNFTGICHHAGHCDRYMIACGNCPLLNSCAAPHDLSASTFARKKKAYDKAGIIFVGVSSWLTGCARRSNLLGDQRVELIHNALPVEKFMTEPAFSREQLGLPADKKLIMFCAARIDDPIKQHNLAIDALNLLADTHGERAFAVFVGDLRDTECLGRLRLPHVHLGPIYSPGKIQSLMAHSSVVLSTSSFETLPTILIEGQAAAAVPVGFVHDGRADIIQDGLTGYAIESSDNPAASTAAAICKALDNPISAEALRTAASRFSYRSIADKYLSLLQTV